MEATLHPNGSLHLKKRIDPGKQILLDSCKNGEENLPIEFNPYDKWHE